MHLEKKKKFLTKDMYQVTRNKGSSSANKPWAVLLQKLKIPPEKKKNKLARRIKKFNYCLSHFKADW